MKILAFLSTLLFSITAFCQIPNQGFENWSIIDGVEEPDNWVTNNTPSPSYRSVTKTDDRYEGDFALQVMNKGQVIEGFGPGYATTIFTINDLVNTVSAYVKCDSLAGMGKGKMYVYGYLNSEIQQISYWETSVLIPEYTLIEIPLNTVLNYDSIAIRIEAFAIFEFLEHQFARLKVDQLNTEMVTGKKNLGVEHTLEVHPNPTDGSITLEVSQKEVVPAKVTLFDMNGHKMLEQTVNSNPVRLDGSSLPQGIYTIKVFLQNGGILSGRIVIAR